jgi:hypothetical protein
MPLVPLDIPPGVYRNGTEYESKGRWFDTNLVRWREGRLEPVGGWTNFDATSPAISGTARGIHSWRNNSQNPRLAVGTSTKLYISTGGKFYEIQPADLVEGREDSFLGVGYGSGNFGQEPYGVERISGELTLNATTWSLDNWGEYLVACSTADGRLIEWTGDENVVAAVIANAPIDCQGLLVSNERHLVALGADGDPRKVAFSDQEDNTTWTPAASNLAGDLLLETSGNIKCARKVGADILIWTDVDVHLMRYLGPPYVYGIERIGTNCGIIGPNGMVVAGNTAVWLSESGFWIYDGAIRPLQCDALIDVTDQINAGQGNKTFGGHNSEFGEMWFFYPSASSTENDKYIIYNYRYGHWAVGSLARTCWVDQGVFRNPIAVDPDGVSYFHEIGSLDNGATRVGDVYAVSGPIELGQGDRFAVVDRIITDDYENLPSLKAVIGTKNTPEESYSDSEFLLGETDGYIDVRLTARQLRVKLEATRDEQFKFGTIRMNLKQGSRR